MASNENHESNNSQKVALVTGAGQGIGRAIAIRLAHAGYDLVLNDLPLAMSNPDAPLHQTATTIRELGRETLLVPADVGQRQGVEQLVEQAWGHFGNLDVVVSNAAFNRKQLVIDTSWDDAKRIFDVTMLGAFHLGQLTAQRMTDVSLARPELLNTPRAMIFIGSIHAELSVPFHTAYAMAKSAITQLCKSLAAELIEQRINVNAINPGWIDTPGERAFLSEEEIQAAAKELPWGRLGRPDEIAELACFLTSAAARYITGEVITIDGGLRLFPGGITKGL